MTTRCISKTSTDMRTNRVSADSNISWEFNLAKSREELYRSLNTQNGVSGSFTYGSFAGEGAHTDSIMKGTSKVSSNYRVVGRMFAGSYVDFAYSPIDFNDLTTQAKSAYNKGQDYFRSYCGDGYVNAITYGSKAYFTATVIQNHETSTTIKNKNTSLSLSLGSVFGASGSQSKKSKLIRDFQSYRFEIKTMTVGISKASSVAVTDINGLVAFIEHVSNPSNHKPRPTLVSYTPYQFPQYPTKDFSTSKSTYNKWLAVKDELRDRCSIFSAKSNPHYQTMARRANEMLFKGQNLIQSYCESATNAVNNHIRNCSDSEKWASCIAPTSQHCRVGNKACAIAINGNVIPAWVPVEKTATYRKKFKSGKTHHRTFNICFSGNTTMHDLRRGSLGYNRESNNRNGVHKHTSTNYRCDRTDFYVKSRGGINFNSTVTLFGLRAEKTPILTSSF